MVIKDARTYQILFLSLFLVLGIGTRDWTLRPEIVAVAIATAVITQALLATGRNIAQQTVELPLGWVAAPDSWPSLFNAYIKTLLDNIQSGSLGISSALITALGLSILLRTEHYTTMILAAVLAIVSKFVLKFRGKHLFNPANFGIIAALTFTSDAWVSPGQWGEQGWYVLLFLSTGGLVLQRVGRWDTTVIFLTSYAGLEALRNLALGWTWDVWAHRLMSGSLLMFALFMITDPRTIPDARIGRLIWAIALALITFFLRNWMFVSTAMFWSLFMLTPLAVLLDYWLPATRFSWRQTAPKSADPRLISPA
jgi:Na+-transporting NADH:ubiquinone oxidoreductase subunit NqrB